MTPADHHLGRQRTLADYIAIVRRRKWVALIPVLLVPLVAYLSASQQSAVYSSSAEVLLSRQDLNSTLTGAPNPDVFTDPDRIADTQAALARVPEVARRAITGAGVRAVSAEELLLSSTVTPRGNADLLSFTVLNGDPDVAGRLATAYATAFTAYRLELDTATMSGARRDLQRRLGVLARQGATDTPLYRTLTQRVQELQTMELLQTRPTVVKIAEGGVQVAPTPRRDAMLGMGLGLLLGLAAVFLWEALDRRVRDEEEIRRALDIPLLARLPAPRSNRLAMLDDAADVDAEAVRRLRSSVEFANLDVDAKVLMITSSVGEEGKTTTISNLAIALARAGHRVALVDLDLRKPTIGRFFGIELRPGLADVAIERVKLENALVPAQLRVSKPINLSRASAARRTRAEEPEPKGRDHGGELFILPAGFLPASPGELVGTQAVAGIIAKLREHMDFVLIDAPPLLTVSDAATLSRRVDGILVITRLGRVNRPMLGDLARELEASPAPKLGFILTGADAAEHYGLGTYSYLAKGEAPERGAADAEASSFPLDFDEAEPAFADRRTSPPGS